MASWHHVIACLINLIVVSKKEILTVTVLLETMVVVYHCNKEIRSSSLEIIPFLITGIGLLGGLGFHSNCTSFLNI